jgi:hypothetical protein
MSKSKSADVLSSYKYNEAKPIFTLDNLKVFDAEHKDNGLKFTLKLISGVDSDLVDYLRKLKSNVSEYTIKIIEFIHF